MENISKDKKKNWVKDIMHKCLKLKFVMDSNSLEKNDVQWKYGETSYPRVRKFSNYPQFEKFLCYQFRGNMARNNNKW